MCSRRASGLRTYAGDTSLPGGKWEPTDRSVEWTAVSTWLGPVLSSFVLVVDVIGQRREAFEEVCVFSHMDRVTNCVSVRLAFLWMHAKSHFSALLSPSLLVATL